MAPEPLTRRLPSPDPVLSVLYPQLNLLNPPPGQNSWVRHWITLCIRSQLLEPYMKHAAITFGGCKYLAHLRLYMSVLC